LVNSQKVELSPLYRGRIKQLHDTKMVYNAQKIAQLGSYDTDDHGWIPFDSIPFTPTPNHEDGGIYGCKALGENLRAFFNAVPAYIHPESAVAGCWVGSFQNYAKIGLRPEDKPEHLRPMHEKYHIRQSGIGGMNHLGPDMKIGLDLGWGGLLAKIRWYKSFNAPKDTGFYDGEEQLVLGVQEYVAHHAVYAREMAEAEDNSYARRNYLEIAAMNEWLVENPPRTFREACQFLAHFQSVDRTYFAGGALSQLDEILRPYYEKDVRDGALTDEEAVWIIASLFYNDTHYSQIGGITPDGSHDMTSRLSFIILEAMHHLHIPINMAVRVHDQVNPDLMRRAVEYIMEDGTGVCFSLADGNEEGFARNGYPKQLARMRAKVGCNWVALPGIEYPLQDMTRVNFAWPFLIALDDVMADGIPSIERLWERFSWHLEQMVDCLKEGYDWHFEVVSRNTPEIVLNLFCHGPIERGLNCAEGGVDIMNLNIDGIALATVADSFAAIEQRVVKEGRLTWHELYTAIKNNYEGAENIRLMLKNIPRFGHPSSLAENWAVKIKDEYVHFCKRSATPKHKIGIIPGMFSHGDVYIYGAELPATPNGRKNGEAISHSSEPDPGFARGVSTFSPSLKANAVAISQGGFGNSAPLHLDIDTNMLKKEGGVDALIALIHTHNHMGGTLINLNCITREQIMKAHEDPSTYPDLIVRVTGYSAFFASLSKEYRQQIVDRFLSNEVMG